MTLLPSDADCVRVLGAVDEESLAQWLEGTGRFKVLRKVGERHVEEHDRTRYPRLALIVDTETTGLSHLRDEVVEFGAIAVGFDDDGMLGPVVGRFHGFRQPTMPISAGLTALTGITQAMVEGQSIDIAALERFVDPADLVIAHNARFDRPFCEALTPAFRNKAWACSMAEVRWRDRGFEGQKLSHLVAQSGFFYDKHRAISDCQALLEILARAASPAMATPFAELWHSSRRPRIRIRATQTPFEAKDRLKSRGYRWSDGGDGQQQGWWKDMALDRQEAELAFLLAQIYTSPHAAPIVERVTAVERYRIG